MLSKQPFNQRLQEIMHKRGLVTLDGFAEELKIPNTRLSAYQSGRIFPRKEMLTGLARCLQVNPEWLKGRSNILMDYATGPMTPDTKVKITFR